MKKIFVFITAIVMSISIMPVYATDSYALNNSELCCDTVYNPLIEPRISFYSCPVNGCGGTVYLDCSGVMASDNTLASFSCTFSAHNYFEDCNHYVVYYHNEGRCNRCLAPLAYLISDYSFSPATHVHSYKHVYSVGNGTYATEYIVSCRI